MVKMLKESRRKAAGGREGERKANRPLSKDVSFFEGGVTPAAAPPEGKRLGEEEVADDNSDDVGSGLGLGMRMGLACRRTFITSRGFPIRMPAAPERYPAQKSGVMSSIIRGWRG